MSEDDTPVQVEAPPSPAISQRLLALVWKAKTPDVSACIETAKIPGIGSSFFYFIVINRILN